MPNENLYSKYKYIWEQLDNTMDSLFSYIQSYPLIEMDSYGNITVSNSPKPQADKGPVFCCHLDTVHKEAPELELVKDDILISLGGGGVGGDDKCGIIACLELLRRIPCKCIFFRDEESGCRGSRTFNATSLKDNMFCIEIDRRGSNDLIFTACYGRMCSEEFQTRVEQAFPHCKAERGSLTDVCVLDKAEINMMNLSAGYHRPHTDKEYVVLSELQTNIDCLVALTEDIIANPLKAIKYKRSKNKTHQVVPKIWNPYPTGTGEEDPDLFGQSEGADDYEAMQYGRYKKDFR